MRHSEQHARTSRKSGRLTQAAGWTSVAFGTAHVLVAPYDMRDGLSSGLSDGWWNAFTLEPSTTLAEFERSEAFWVTFGSFGAPMLVLGSYVVWSARQGQRVPGWLGWALIAWGAPLAFVLPSSPGWAIPVIGALLVLGDHARKRDLAGERPSTLEPAETTRPTPRAPKQTMPDRLLRLVRGATPARTTR